MHIAYMHIAYMHIAYIHIAYMHIAYTHICCQQLFENFVSMRKFFSDIFSFIIGVQVGRNLDIQPS